MENIIQETAFKYNYYLPEEYLEKELQQMISINILMSAVTIWPA